MSETKILSTELVEVGAGRLELDAAEVRVVAGPDRGACIALAADSLRIGSACDCEVVLHDPTVSSRHAEIELTRHGYFINDVDSTNGLFIGTTRIRSAALHDGMRIRIGHSALLVRALAGRHTVPLVRPGRWGRLVAHSVKMRAAVATLERLAATDMTVLLEGETGTGKEVAAQSLHEASTRASGPFTVFDCSAMSNNLLSSELFGHERGAFTDALRSRPGIFEEADGGTLFLDEVGELPVDLQPALLRAIERKVTRRLGSTTDRSLDVRVVAATNRNLQEEVRAKRFREDLYFRLAVGRVRLPPLRERPEDLLLLARLFAEDAGATLSPEILALLRGHRWPGNVRELRNVVTRIAAQPDEAADVVRESIEVGSDPLREDATLRPLIEARRHWGELFERRYLEEALALTEGNLSRAAEIAGVTRTVFTRLAAKHRMRARDRREP